MQKPIYLLPFIFVYKIVLFIVKIPFYIIRYFTLGTLYTISRILRLVEINIKGFIWICYFIYAILLFPFRIGKKKRKKSAKKTIKKVETPSVVVPAKEKVAIEMPTTVTPSIKEEKKEPVITITDEATTTNSATVNGVTELITEAELKRLEKQKLTIQKKIIKEQNKSQKVAKDEEVFKRKEEARILKEQRKNEKKQKQNDSYINKDVDISGSGLKAKLQRFGKKITNIPTAIKNKFNNNEFVKHSRNKQLMQREALLINFEGEDAEKSDVKLLYEYIAKNKEGQVIKGYFEAFSKVEVHSYLLSEGFEVYSIRTNKWIQFVHGSRRTNHTKIKTKDLIFFLTQLSTYIKAGIPLVEALKILSRQFKQKSYKKIFESIVYDLTTGENFSEALLKQNVAFPRLLINMVKTSEMTGELPEVLDDMSAYYTETERTRKQMITALMYPSIVFVFAVAVITFIMMFVIPQFVEIYETMDASQIPAFTLAVIAFSEFIQKYILWILIGIIIFILLFIYLYHNVKVFRTICQWILMHIPVIGTTVIYNEVTMFTKTFSSLLAHNVFITDSMEVLNKITNNEIYKMLILDTITNLAKGEKISAAFADHWAFPIPAYEMLVTGEKTGELAEMMEKVSIYYQDLHKESVTRIKTFIEPILTVVLTAVVGVIILAVIIPMFNMYGSIQNY